MPLTDVAVRTALPGAKRIRLFDGGGLYLEIAPTGGKWWRLKYRHAGVEKRISLGTFPLTSLKAARLARDRAKVTSQEAEPEPTCTCKGDSKPGDRPFMAFHDRCINHRVQFIVGLDRGTSLERGVSSRRARLP